MVHYNNLPSAEHRLPGNYVSAVASHIPVTCHLQLPGERPRQSCQIHEACLDPNPLLSSETSQESPTPYTRNSLLPIACGERTPRKIRPAVALQKEIQRQCDGQKHLTHARSALAIVMPLRKCVLGPLIGSKPQLVGSWMR